MDVDLLSQPAANHGSAAPIDTSGQARRAQSAHPEMSLIAARSRAST